MLLILAKFQFQKRIGVESANRGEHLTRVYDQEAQFELIR